MGIIVNDYFGSQKKPTSILIRIPIKEPGFNGKYLRGFCLFCGSDSGFNYLEMMEFDEHTPCANYSDRSAAGNGNPKWWV